MKKFYYSLLLLFTFTSGFSQLEGTWKLAPAAQSLAVGPGLGDFSWWSNTSGDVSTRACLFDDKFVFNADGSFENIQDGATWLEPWQGTDPEACGAPIAPHDGSEAATYEYNEGAGTLTITGKGAHIGLAKVINGAELTAPASAPNSITYMAALDGNTLTLDIEVGGGGYWHFVLEKEGTPTPSPLSGTTWKMAPQAAALGVGPMLGDLGWWSNTADDVNTRACFFDDKFVFNADGSFENVQDGSTWLEPWQGVDPEACGTPIAPHDGSNAATWSHDVVAGTVTLTGVGAHLGLAKVINLNEIGAPGDAPASITYPVVLDGNTMTIDIEIANGAYWHFVLEKEVPPVDLSGTTWKLAPQAAALAVGPALNDFSWWANTADDVNTRACLFDDQFVFNADGSFQNIQGTETWVEPWQGTDPEGCATPVAPHDGSNAATWSYDDVAKTITLTGVGAHLGLAKVINGAELTTPADAPASITYMAAVDGSTMTVDIEVGGGGYWHFVFVEDDGTSTVEIVEEDLFTFFPNPANTQIQIQSDEIIDDLIIRDITGKIQIMKMNPSSNETIDVSRLTNGFYIMECRVGNKVSVEKLSINR